VGYQYYFIRDRDSSDLHRYHRAMIGRVACKCASAFMAPDALNAPIHFAREAEILIHKHGDDGRRDNYPWQQPPPASALSGTARARTRLTFHTCRAIRTYVEAVQDWQSAFSERHAAHGRRHGKITGRVGAENWCSDGTRRSTPRRASMSWPWRTAARVPRQDHTRWRPSYQSPRLATYASSRKSRMPHRSCCRTFRQRRTLSAVCTVSRVCRLACLWSWK